MGTTWGFGFMKSKTIKNKKFTNLNIQVVRKSVEIKVKEALSKRAATQFLQYNKAEKNQIKIINDAVVYAIMRLQRQHGTSSYENNIVVKNLLNGVLIDKLYRKRNTGLTFQGVIRKIKNELNIKHKLSIIDSDSIMRRKDISNDTKLAIQLFLQRGKFEWRNVSGSKFSQFLSSDRTQLGDSSLINCWEAVLYSMYRARLITKKNLKNLYKDDIYALQDRLKNLYKFKSRSKIASYSSKDGIRGHLRTNAKLIMFDDKGGDGLQHNFVSVPYTQKNVLNMLINNDFELPPSKPKIYSLWTNWTNGKLDTTSKKTIANEVKTFSKEMRTLNINELAKMIEKNY
jgi:hypothetical protein